RGREANDVNKPKGKTSAYAFFVQTCREEHRKKNPEQSVNFAEFSKKCSERWKGLSASDKKCFEDMAKADKVRYNREMRDYVPPKGFGKRGRKRKDPNAPKRPPSAFFVFCSEYRPSVKQQYPGLSIGDCAKKLGEMWSKLTQSEKQPYEEKAQKLREKYDRDMVAYRGGGSYAARNPDSSAQGGEEEEEDEGEEEEEEEEDDE
uniref:High mobility group box 2b n=1 Tax=Takifugu rubripes TaxID=31033 RepID=A0A674PJG5_TAKRU